MSCVLRCCTGSHPRAEGDAEGHSDKSTCSVKCVVLTSIATIAFAGLIAGGVLGLMGRLPVALPQYGLYTAVGVGSLGEIGIVIFLCKRDNSPNARALKELHRVLIKNRYSDANINGLVDRCGQFDFNVVANRFQEYYGHGIRKTPNGDAITLDHTQNLDHDSL